MNPNASTIYAYHDPFNRATYRQLERLLALVDFLPIDSVGAFLEWAKGDRFLSRPLDMLLYDWEEYAKEQQAA